MQSDEFRIRHKREADDDWVAQLLEEHWGSAQVVTRGKIHDAHQLPGFVAVREAELVGLVTYRIDGDECEIVTLNSLVRGIGIGSALINAVNDMAVSAKCSRLWLVTTNDNTPALCFYQTRGFMLVAVHRNAVERSRKLKPEIPLYGIENIPIRDEIELELIL